MSTGGEARGGWDAGPARMGQRSARGPPTRLPSLAPCTPHTTHTHTHTPPPLHPCARSNPSFLLLDEPTSGLDAFQAQNVMESLWVLASNGRTVISTIHPPRSSIYT